MSSAHEFEASLPDLGSGGAAAAASGALSLERELQEFARLQGRLRALWGQVFAADDAPYESVVVPSLTLPPDEIRTVPEAAFLEERLLLLLIRLRNPRARLVYVTSHPIHPLVLEYYLQLLVGIPASHARARLTLLCVHDVSARPLTQKLLERPRLLARIRGVLRDPERAYLTVYNSTPLERRLAVCLGLPLDGADPSLAELGTKSGSRRVFRAAGLALPDGVEDLRDEADVVEALAELKRRHPGLAQAVVKRNVGSAGDGNALVRYPDTTSRPALRAALEALRCSRPGETCEGFFEPFRRVGGVVEACLDGPGTSAPSVQLRLSPNGEVSLSSTHEQVLGGPIGQAYEGACFPAAAAYRLPLQQAGLALGRELARRGVVSRLSADFVAQPGPEGGPHRLYACEINLRMGGTTHPMLALRFLTEGRLEAESGLFRSARGQAKYYRTTDTLRSPAFRGLLPEDVVEILTLHRLAFDPQRETGVLFHMLGAVSQYGTLGLVAVGDDADEAERLYTQAARVLAGAARSGAAAES